MPEVVVNVEHVGEQRLGGALLQLELLHSIVQHYRLSRDLLARPTHSQDPRKPLQEHGLDLRAEKVVSMINWGANFTAF